MYLNNSRQIPLVATHHIDLSIKKYTLANAPGPNIGFFSEYLLLDLLMLS